MAVHQVFVSAASLDLRFCREDVRQVLARRGEKPIVQEEFTATHQEIRQKLRDTITPCDAVICIVGFAYGSEPTARPAGVPRRSFTQIEFDAAQELNKPTYVFLSQEEENFPSERAEDAELRSLQATYRHELQSSGRDWTSFRTREQLREEIALLRFPWQGRDVRELIQRLLQKYESEFIKASDLAQSLTLEDAFERHLTIKVVRAADPQKERVELDVSMLLPRSRVQLVGDGGSGKSTSLLWLAIDAARTALETAASPIPLYARLSAFDATERGFDRMLSLIANFGGLDVTDVERMWRQTERPVIFLLDGLNEVGAAYRALCVDTLAGEFPHDPHACVVSSRLGLESTQLAERARMTVLEMGELDEAAVQQYLSRAGFAEIAVRLPTCLLRLLRNPFMLWAFAQVASIQNASGRAVNRGQLYRLLVDEYLFGSREKLLREATRYDYERVKKPVLALLARRLADSGRTTEPRLPILGSVLAVLDDLETERRLVSRSTETFMPQPSNAGDLVEELVQNGILRASDSNLQFAHESLQDYFTAIGLSALTADEAVAAIEALDWRTVTRFDETARDFMNQHVASPRLEAIIVLCGLVADADAVVELLASRDIIAAARCLADASHVSESARSTVKSVIVSHLSAWNPRKRWIGATAARYGALDDAEIVGELVAIVSGETELAAWDAAYYALNAVARGQNPVTGKQWAKRHVDRLLTLFGQAQTSTGRVGPTFDAALAEMAAGDAESWKLEDLVDAVETHWSPHVRSAARVALSQRAQNAAEGMISALIAGEPEQKIVVAKAFAAARAVNVGAALVAALNAPQSEVRVAALEALTEIRDDDTVAAITAAAQSLLRSDQSLAVQGRAFLALSRVPGFDSQAAAVPLNVALSSADVTRDPAAVLTAASALLEGGGAISPEALAKLVAIARRGTDKGLRTAAFQMTLQAPGGRSVMMDSIYERLQAGDYQWVITEIGADEPFVDSPNLILWRGIAFHGLGQIDRAIRDAQEYVNVAPNPGAAGWAFLVVFLEEAGQSEKALEARTHAMESLPPADAEEFRRIVG
jgi:tetratricopeptide (TPR) repeat protein